ncbi:MAG TPA: SOS response-associated peptidase [Phycisphaerales bacterium]|nr:SOS response-associated peptidase [Phycisphaerales bacterium]
MCGRFLLITPARVVAELFRAHAGLTGSQDAILFQPRYNIAPSQPVLVVRNTKDGTGRELAGMRWGLVPSWAKDESIGLKTINCRSETALEKPMFRSLYERRRCLVPADGFYEWKAVPGRRTKQPMLIQVREAGQPKTFAMAALWDRWRPPEGEPIDSVTILTTAANEQVAPVHDRMPVILPASAWDDWLAARQPAPSAVELSLTPVSTLVSNVRNDGPDLVRPVAVEEQGGLF